MEEDEEQGLAHFVEHMGFKGTASFEKYHLVKVLQYLGITYGPDLNASTHLLETKYNLSINKDENFEQLKMGIEVLKEWAFHMTMKSDDIEEEKQVISSELLAKKGLSERMLKKYWSSIFKDPSGSSLLDQRMPIGIPEIFMNTNSNQLSNFYKKWYTPKNMAIVIVGPISGQEDLVYSIMESVFNSIDPGSDSQPKLKDMNNSIHLPSHHTKDVIMAISDKELTSTQLSIEFFSPFVAHDSTSHIKDHIMRRLLTSLIDQRLAILTKRMRDLPDNLTVYTKDNSPFLSIGISIRELVRGLLCVGINAMLKRQDTTSRRSTSTSSRESESNDSNEENAMQSHQSKNSGVEEIKLNDTESDVDIDDIKMLRKEISVSLQALLLEMKRFQTHGIYDQELFAAKEKWRQLFVDQRNHNMTTSSSVASELVDHILHNEETLYVDPVTEACLSIDCLDEITVTDMNEMLKTIDMNIPDVHSKYYAPQSHSFRALSGQFPIGKLQGKYNSITDDDLRELLIEAQVAVSEMNDILPWPKSNDLSEVEVCQAVKNILNSTKSVEMVCEGSKSSVYLHEETTDVKANIKRKKPVKCLCCKNRYSFLPPSMLLSHDVATNDDMISSNKSLDMISQTMPAVDAYEFQLSNGVTVCAKWMPDISPGKISMQGFALGGSGELTEVEEAIMSLLDGIASQSPFVMKDITFEGKDVLELQSVTKTRINTQRHMSHRGLGGSCPTNKFELLLAFLALKLTSQRIDESAFNDALQRQLAFLVHRDNSPEHLFMDTARILTCGDIPVLRPFTKDILDQCTYEMAQEIYDRAFSTNPTEFTFVFVGDLPPMDVFKELLSTYVSNLSPSSDLLQKYSQIELEGETMTQEDISLHSCHWIRNRLQHSPLKMFPFRDLDEGFIVNRENAYQKMNTRESEKASKLYAFRVDFLSLDENENVIIQEMMDVTCKVLQIYLLEELRIRLGKVYSVVVEWSRNSLSSLALVSVVMHCDPGDIDVVGKAIEERIAHLQENGPNQTDLVGIVEAKLRQHKQSLKHASYWLFWLLDGYKSLQVHRWRCKELIKNPLSTTSHDWVSSHCLMKSHEKQKILQENVTLENVKRCFIDIFNFEKSVHLDLCPVSSTEL